MDYLTTNWTEKIKTNPVANKILNGNKSQTIRHVSLARASEYNFEDNELDDIDMNDIVRNEINMNDWNAFVSQHNTEEQIINKIQKRYRGRRNQMQRRRNNNKDPEVQQQEFEKMHDDKYGGYGILPAWFYDYNPDEEKRSTYWDNVYVKDYINIAHPKLRTCYVSAMSKNPLQIKPPSVFFSDV